MAELVPITIAVVLYGQRAKTLAWKGSPVPPRAREKAAAYGARRI
jgi:hypothetical protein